jgi:hypothetical protein
MVVGPIALVFRVRRERSKITHLLQRALAARLTLTRDLLADLRRPIPDPRHLLAHLENAFELFFQERLSHLHSYRLE